MVWGKAGSTTLSSAGDAYELTITSSKTFQILDHTIPSGSTGQQINFNNDTTTSYALRYSGNGGTDGTSVNRTSINHEWDQTRLDRFVMDYWSDVSGEETLGISFSVYNDSTGAGSAPSRFKEVWKWDDTSQVTEIDMINPGSGSFDTDSNLTVLGSDITPAAAVPALGANVQVGSRYEETDTRKMYNLNTEPIYSEDFTTDPAGWTDDSYTNRTNNQVEIRPSTSSSASGVAYIDLSNASNLGSNLSDTKWTVDFKIDVVDLTQSVTNYVYVRYWLSDNTSSSNSGDEIGFNHWARNTESGRARFYKVNGGTGATLSTHVGAINSTGVRYCRIIRESATSARLLISTNADWSGAVDSGSQTIESTINGLKYFKITCTGYNGSNRLNVNLDDLRVYEGVDKGTTAFETGTPDTSSIVWQEIGA